MTISGEQLYMTFPEIMKSMDNAFIDIDGENMNGIRRLCEVFGSYFDEKFDLYDTIPLKLMPVDCEQKWLDYFAHNIGFPLPGICNDTQKRLLLKYIYRIVYKLAGTATGINRAIFFFTRHLSTIHEMTSFDNFNIARRCLVSVQVPTGTSVVPVKSAGTFYNLYKKTRLKIITNDYICENEYDHFDITGLDENGRVRGNLYLRYNTIKPIVQNSTIVSAKYYSSCRTGFSMIGCNGRRDCFKVGTSSIGRAMLNGQNVRFTTSEKSKNNFYFIVNIYGVCDDNMKKFIDFIVDYMKPARTFYVIKYHDGLSPICFGFSEIGYSSLFDKRRYCLYGEQ